MRATDLASRTARKPTAAPYRIGCVSYLNAKPLIHGVDEQPWADVRFAVPSELLADLEHGRTDIALCPVIDYFRSSVPLQIVPVGAIGCEGATLTVRLFSRVPLGRITCVHADTDSHTSVALLRIIMAKHLKRDVQIVDYHAPREAGQPRRGDETGDGETDRPEAVLLIGDKVIRAEPDPKVYPHQLDLGEAWHDITGLPFVFAVWMTREGERLGTLPGRLAAVREANAGRIDAIADIYAARHGWPFELARDYLGRMLQYDVQKPQTGAIVLFAELAHELGLTSELRPLQMYPHTR